MKPEDIIDAIGSIDDVMIRNAAASRDKKKKRRTWVKWVAIAACFCIVVGAVLGHFHFNPSPKPAPPSVNVNLNNCSVSNAVYPQTVKYPVETDFDDGNGNLDWRAYSTALDNWYADFDSRRANFAVAGNYSKFFTTTVKTFLTDTKGENLVYSPVNVYMALSLLAESTDGQTRNEILGLLGAQSIDKLRALASKLWISNYADDGLTTSILANSVWMDDSVEYNKSTLELLAGRYFASSFKGNMGSAEYNSSLQKWLNDQTGGLLREQANNIEFNRDTVLGLASTVYFKAGWSTEFSKHLTKADTFNGVQGNSTVDFMYQRVTYSPLYSDKNYTATALPFNNSGKMWLILPDDGITPEALIQNGDINPILNGSTPENTHSNTIINLYVPKFDVTSSVSLIDGIKSLGVSDVFDEAVADFSPIMPNQSGYVSQIEHSARVTVDEEGCTAAAFTVIGVDTEASITGKEVDFRLNRPFIFVITADNSTPLFVGVVNNLK